MVLECKVTPRLITSKEYRINYGHLFSMEQVKILGTRVSNKLNTKNRLLKRNRNWNYQFMRNINHMFYVRSNKLSKG